MNAVRADQVGSLLRPAALREARQAHQAGRLGAAELAAVEDEAIHEALAGQQATGIDVYTDGEFRRGVYMLGLVDAVDDQWRKLELVASVARTVWN
jgi:5-methyltetrahydropteroyltriglutamate--homocysteine methyltransferase